MQPVTYVTATAGSEPVRRETGLLTGESLCTWLTDQLQQRFAGQTDMRCLLVVDPSLRGLADRPDDGALFSRAWSMPVPVGHPAFPPDHQPCLMELDLTSEAGRALLAESVRIAFEDRDPESVARGYGQRTGGWLFTRSTPADVAAHWASHIVQRDEENRPRVLRFYDARVLSLMWPTLSGPQ